MALIADRYDYVIGVDTHARTHTFVIIECRTGGLIDSRVFPASRAGTARAVAWIGRRAPSSVFAAVEGTSSYGAQLTSALVEAGIPVGEVRPPARTKHAIDGKSDTLDARKPVTDTQISTIAAWRTSTHQDPVIMIARDEARRLARTITEHTALLRHNHAMLGERVEQAAPGLQSVPGMGPVTAAIIICAYSHHGRIRSEAAFAALAGVAPLPASSGNTIRHRLNRTGDRQLNRAFDIIVRTRLSCDPDTRAYADRSRARGKTPRETRRTLKRYVCRAVFRQLQATIAAA